VDQEFETIAEQVRDLRARTTPNATSDLFLAEQSALDAMTPPAVLPVGSAMPDGDLLDAGGVPTSLRGVLGGSPGVVIFYRGAWCPYCNIALRTYQHQLASPLAELGVRLVAISPQTADGSMTMREKHDLEFEVLSDPGNQIAGQLGILTEPSAVARSAQLGRGLDVAERNADGTLTIPMPTVALVDHAGVLVWIDVHRNYATRTEPAEILTAVNEFLPATASN
jgi:peroxiredoxin